MNKYKIGQTVYWFKYVGHQPDLMCFEIGSIKQTKDGYKYSSGEAAAQYIQESYLFDSIAGAVDNGYRVLRGFLNDSD
jgi:hypothetical protein